MLPNIESFPTLILSLLLLGSISLTGGCSSKKKEEPKKEEVPVTPEPVKEVEKKPEPVKPLTAAESEPKLWHYMEGFPPPQDKILSAIDGSFFKFPAMRYSVCHMRQFFPTVNVPSAQEKRYHFEAYPDPRIASLTFIPIGATDPITWEESLQRNYTDGIIVLHRGKIVYEKYAGCMTENGIHALMSVTKTFTGTLAATLVAEGKLDDAKLVRDYIPALATSGFGDATVRQVLDMTTAIRYSEDYANPKAEVWSFTAAGNPFPQPPDYIGPRNYYDFLKTIQKDGNHGDAFGYKTPNADLAGWLVSVVTNEPIAKLLSERFWQPLGATHDAYYQIDSAGIAFAGGGLNANLRDVAKFGQMILDDGRFNGQQIIPKKVVDDIKRGGSPEAFARAGYTSLKGWSYRNMWWKTNNEDGAFSARGVHGQTIYIDPKAEMVIVRVASHPIAANSANDANSLPAYQAVADYLKSLN